MALKAKVTVVAMVDGKRKEFQPGDELPKLSAHDVQSLKNMDAIEDTGETEQAAKAASAAEKSAGKEFAAARKRVQAEQASIVVAEENQPAGEPAK